ncbi:type 2 isopentenyl-diphosphate Delta-isomerase (plasmid) [Haloferax mediterranei ATCC 33500]|uniref:Isopentenyl-diphosphate delta-isomerase n=1 Tax=Haloferax mediterranei (strain ATCC 33500 / DSM 1411 / JCM 8866 / NBRC 14739 / NCIMB 2177 / R-4) TaxID=523841 RepID=I3R9V0_HALMT|nr:type 2 isopentenyl-diphosphate Delta-isomerase [Haloferax mediterranei]AFK21010.1 isopentenyl-diphosphate delta-isomerase, type II [Haloferax mediterranei ATCC 33500]AHZ24128.1 isopentenyl pyrophosphate isomerase [Haloferax mediterranei ATCC 33500]EMA05204.1 isopentenyl pyrophosphate isomerase [Haloferax mediterranei ATCC 33500]MDX5989991.1 type 2 isopentenyl-diphosphate Delta-isomerase [Haloferax mediterranei ATCC 33500]QCQ77174.1 type 2 isopentenyl-diphosphate Delta-isomerase [Haloferax m
MAKKNSSETEDRKDDHIRIIQEKDVETTGTGFEDVQLVHEALPEFHHDDIDLSVDFLGSELAAPIVIESMTGGHPNTTKINRALAAGAAETGIAMGVGSQRAGLELDDEDLLESYTVVRDAAPDAFIYGNIGAAQLREYETAMVERAVEMIDADALAVHLNFLQEAVQPEGDINAEGCLAAIERVSSELSVPIVVKETGNGIAGGTAKSLTQAGVDAIDVAGKGGTTWSGIEAYRAAAVNASRQERVGTLFRSWGVPTAVSTLECAREHDCVIASGGVRTGLDIAKAIALGAQAGGLAKPFLKPATQGVDAVVERVEDLIAELQTAMFVTGSQNVAELQNADYVLLGDTREYVTQRRD